MLPFRLLLILMLVSIVVYTGGVISTHGIDFVSVFFGDIAKQNWAGQFNLDFMGLLLLCAVWVAWRHRFSAAGLGLACVAAVGGTPFLCVYLLVESFRIRGDVRALLLGAQQQVH